MQNHVGAGSPPFGADDWVEAVDALVIDACIPDRGHRLHVLAVRPLQAAELEAGVGGATDATTKDGKPALRLRMTLDTGMRGDTTTVFVTGVAFRDANANKLYDLGEGVGGVEVVFAAAGVKTTTAPGGGYALPVPRAPRARSSQPAPRSRSSSTIRTPRSTSRCPDAVTARNDDGARVPTEPADHDEIVRG